MKWVVNESSCLYLIFTHIQYKNPLLKLQQPFTPQVYENEIKLSFGTAFIFCENDHRGANILEPTTKDKLPTYIEAFTQF